VDTHYAMHLGRPGFYVMYFGVSRLPPGKHDVGAHHRRRENVDTHYVRFFGVSRVRPEFAIQMPPNILNPPFG